MEARATFDPTLATLCKIGSILVHYEEATSANGHPFDVVAFRQLMADPDVVAWLAAMRAAGLLPAKR